VGSKSQPDGLLVARVPIENTTAMRELIIVPQSFVPALLTQLHIEENFPSHYQLLKHFRHSYFAIDCERIAKEVTENCYKCEADKPLTKEIATFTTVSDPDHPGSHYNADIIQRKSQCIFVLRDQFSCLTAACLTPDQKTETCKRAIITHVQASRARGNVEIRVDNGPAFESLSMKKDPDLEKLGISIILVDKLNKNGVASVDKAIQELEFQFRRLCPESAELSLTTLALIV
jgi:hypothetical protein